jgi:hypothetical protein
VSPPPTTSPGSPPPAGTTTVRGQIEEGVEAGCLMLPAGGTLYQLVGGDRTTLRAGNTVEVTGDVQPDLATTCQQGVPLVVRTARLL